jgi:uncharacterized protein (DUF2126 family)
MPPDPRMSLAQQLLIRALIAKLWREPQQGKFVRWGTTLHDRFMLPHFLWEDFLGVLDELKQSGYDFSPDWYAAQLEFRFPVFGRVHHGGVSLEVRQALEPWHVPRRRGLGRRHRALRRFIGGAAAGQGHGLRRRPPRRHLQRPADADDGNRPLGRGGGGRPLQGLAAGLGLHPTIPVHAPLTFDLIDTWNGRSLGGCVYHVAHPAGAATRPSRSIPTRPRRAGWPGFRTMAIPPARSIRRARNAQLNSH